MNWKPLQHAGAGKNVKKQTVIDRGPAAKKEASIDNYEVTSWYGILTSAGTPCDIVTRLNTEWMKIVTMPDTIEKMQKAGVEPPSGKPEQFSDFIKAETVRWAKVIKKANLSVD